jgi:pyrimidine operon attenuation protein/uracil phosphoribosyltransferase
LRKLPSQQAVRAEPGPERARIGGSKGGGKASSGAARDQRSKRAVLIGEEVTRCLRRIAHEILERHEDVRDLVIVGLREGGVWVAEVIASHVTSVSGFQVPLGILDATLYRDDLLVRTALPLRFSTVPTPLASKTVILVDDVLFTGRTIRAALNAICDLGRPARVELAVLVDRGHRELPIRPDYVGKNLPTSRHETVLATPEGVFVEGA